MQIKKKVKVSSLSIVSIGVLSLLAVALVCPRVYEETQAADTPVSAGSSSLSVSVSNGTVALEADPTVNSGMALGSVTISAKTTNETGYTMKLSAANTALKSADSTNTATVPTLASNTVLTSFPANRWGYYVGTSAGTTSSTYKPISTTATEIDSTTAANSTLRNQILTVAAKINSTLPAGSYSAQLVVSVVGNAPAVSFGPITTMQEMTSSICSGISSGTEGTLTDTRDGAVYYVGKMKDGKCWMLQNLALGSTSSTITLTPANSNVTSNWSLPKSLTTTTSGSSSNTVVQSWNFDKWVLATPLLGTDCGVTGITSLANCVKAGFVDVSDTSKFQPTYTATTTRWSGANSTSSTLVAVNCTSWSGSGTSKKCTAGTYDPHYLVGNYYSWNAATAGTGGIITSGEASGSICPKGWKLPTSKSGGEFDTLLSQYGVSSSVSGSVNGTTYNIVGEPFRFVRGGIVSPGFYVFSAGLRGTYWSSTPESDNDYYAYSLLFGDSYVEPFPTDFRYYGFSVRCINDSSV